MKPLFSSAKVHAWIALFLLTLQSSSSLEVRADWPQWRGPRRDGYISGELPSQFPATPQVLWKRSFGHGYSSPVVSGNRLVCLDDANGQETAHGLDPATGKTLWSTPIGELFADEFEPGPRCTPLLDGDRAFVQSCKGEFRSLRLLDGRIEWRFHFNDYGAFWVTNRQGGIGAANRRGNSGSPVVAGDRIIVQVGSPKGACLVALNKRTGQFLWKSQDDLTSYASAISGTLAGTPQVIAATCEGLVAVAVEDGRLLWRVPFKTGANRNVLTPLIDGDSVAYSSHTTGFQQLKIEPDGAKQKPAELWFNRSIKINLSTPVLVGDAYYGLGGAKDYIAIDRATGRQLWSQPGFDAVASTVTDGKRLLILNDRGECLLLRVDREKFNEIGRFQACGRTFSHPAFAKNTLYVRDSRELTAYSLAP